MVSRDDLPQTLTPDGRLIVKLHVAKSQTSAMLVEGVVAVDKIANEIIDTLSGYHSVDWKHGADGDSPILRCINIEGSTFTITPNELQHMQLRRVLANTRTRDLMRNPSWRSDLKREAAGFAQNIFAFGKARLMVVEVEEDADECMADHPAETGTNNTSTRDKKQPEIGSQSMVISNSDRSVDHSGCDECNTEGGNSEVQRGLLHREYATGKDDGLNPQASVTNKPADITTVGRRRNDGRLAKLNELLQRNHERLRNGDQARRTEQRTSDAGNNDCHIHRIEIIGAQVDVSRRVKQLVAIGGRNSVKKLKDSASRWDSSAIDSGIYRAQLQEFLDKVRRMISMRYTKKLPNRLT